MRRWGPPGIKQGGHAGDHAGESFKEWKIRGKVAEGDGASLHRVAGTAPGQEAALAHATAWRAWVGSDHRRGGGGGGGGEEGLQREADAVGGSDVQVAVEARAAVDVRRAWQAQVAAVDEGGVRAGRERGRERGRGQGLPQPPGLQGEGWGWGGWVAEG